MNKLPLLSSFDFTRVLTSKLKPEELENDSCKYMRWFTLINLTLPSMYSFGCYSKAEKYYEELYTHYSLLPENYGCATTYNLKDNTESMNSWFVFLREDLLITYKNADANINIYYSFDVPKLELSELVAYYKEAVVLTEEETKVEPKIYFIRETSYKLALQSVAVNKIELDVASNYNDDFQPVHQVIMKQLTNMDGNGIILLHGDPGTGKTSYLRYLTTQVQQKFIYLAPSFAASLSSSKFLNLLMDNAGSVLIIEDAEALIEDRGLGTNFSLSGLLNITDGLLSDMLKMQVICTFNTDIRNINKALLRKGRLIAIYKFDKLEAAKANKLSEQLGYNNKIECATSLAQIYNQNKKDFSFDRKQIKGFGI